MNKFQRQLEVAMQAINGLQDEYIKVLAERKRLHRILYGAQEHKQYTDTLKEIAGGLITAHEDAVKEVLSGKKVKVDLYFDVTCWRWVAFADIEVRV